MAAEVRPPAFVPLCVRVVRVGGDGGGSLQARAGIVTTARSLSLPEEAEALTDSEALNDNAMTMLPINIT